MNSLRLRDWERVHPAIERHSGREKPEEANGWLPIRKRPLGYAGRPSSPKPPLETRCNCFRYGSVTGHRPVNLPERQLFDFLSGGTRPTAVAQVASGERLFRNRSGLPNLCREFWPNLFLGRWLKGLAFQKSEK